jgi:hypothetical protein
MTKAKPKTFSDGASGRPPFGITTIDTPASKNRCHAHEILGVTTRTSSATPRSANSPPQRSTSLVDIR